tara:strand:- start:28 stop:621 length:594 start_codon:yes stop_codon:yes gene_type:complete
MLGINALSNSKAFKTWAAIAFKFNENKIDIMKQMAKQLNFDNFQLTLSTKFGKNYSSYPKNDPLQPSDEYVAVGRFTRQTDSLSDKVWKDNCVDIFAKRYYNENINNKSIVPLCMIGNKGLYINAQGKFYPCCWTGLRYPHNKNVFEYINFNKKLPAVLDNNMWNTLFKDILTGGGPKECGEKCSTKKWSFDHATQW